MCCRARRIADFKKRLDYSEYGGAPLLGVKGVCIICHGRSNANAIKNAIRVAAEFAGGRVNEKIEEELGDGQLGASAARSAAKRIDDLRRLLRCSALRSASLFAQSAGSRPVVHDVEAESAQAGSGTCSDCS